MQGEPSVDSWEQEDGYTEQQWSSLEYAVERQDMVQHFDAYIARNTNTDSTIGRLTVRQSETFLKIRDFAAGEGTNGLLELACGYGKSALETMVCEALGAGAQRADGSERQVLLSTSRLSILKQLVGANVHYTDDDKNALLSDFEYFAPNIAPSVYSGGSKDISGQAVVMPYQCLDAMLRSQEQCLGRFSAYLLDECHNVSHGRIADLKDISPHILKLGLSATPDTSRRYLTTTIDRVPMIDGILKYGFLSGLQMHGISTGYAFYPGYVGAEYSRADTEKLAQVEERNQKIIDMAYANVQQYGPGVIKCHRKAYAGSFSHLDTITRMLNDNPPLITRNGKTRPLRAVAVASSIRESPELMHEYLHGDSIDILTFVDIITEGINLPPMRWGLWTPPTKSHRALEQFIGRGLRRDPADANKTFQFFQLVDVDLRQHLANAFGWELFDMPRDLQSGEIKKGASAKSSRRNPDALDLDIQCIGREIQFVKSVVLDGTRTNTLPDKVIPLSEIVQRVGKRHNWIRQILAQEGFTAFARLVDGEPCMLYDQAAEVFIKNTIATSDDIILNRAARAFGVERHTLRRILRRNGVEPNYLYTSVQTRLIKFPHVTAADLQQVWSARYEDIAPIQPDEILLSDVLDRAGKVSTGALKTDFFRDRGFTVRERRTQLTGPPTVIVLRTEILPWLKAYQNAQPMPENRKDYKSLASYSKYLFAAGKMEKADVFTALRNLGITPMLFKHTHERRFEYIFRSQEAAVTEEIDRIIKHRVQQPHSTAYAASSSTKVAHKPPRLHIPRPIASDYAFIADHEDITDALEDSDDTYSNGEAAPDSTTRKSDCIPSNILRALAMAHPSLSLDMLNDSGRPAADDEFFESIVERNSAALIDVPSTWVVIADLAAKVQMPERQLLRFFIEKKISGDHVQYIELSAARSLTGLCSPELEQFILTKFYNSTRT